MQTLNFFDLIDLDSVDSWYASRALKPDVEPLSRQLPLFFLSGFRPRPARKRGMTERMGQRKSGSRRIDAALDAMRPYGFSKNLVQETVKELLEVYGGSAGWIFVEEASYTLLIETILEKQRDAVPKIQYQVEKEIDEEALPIEGPSHLNEVSYSAIEAINIPLLNHKASDSPPQTTNHGGDIEASQSIIPAAQSTPRSQRHKPYYGWISSDTEEDLIDLPPAYTNEELSKLLHLSSRPKKCNPRWDVELNDS